MSESFPTTREARVLGSHEIITNTTTLAKRLTSPQNLENVTRAFDAGETRLRDVGNMKSEQRALILDCYKAGRLSELFRIRPEMLTEPVLNLHNRIVYGKKDQPLGHNFFVNATGFLRDGFNWAHDFDRAIQQATGKNINEIIQTLTMPEKDQILISVTKNDAIAICCATYLAGRSLASEQYLDSRYGQLLQEAKAETGSLLGQLGASTRLRRDMLVRAAEQLGRVRFGSFDHLGSLVTSDNTGVAGDYQTGTLRVEVKFAGTVAAPRFPSQTEAKHTITHELHHAASAQSVSRTEVRCGLYINGQGFEADEGLTEYLAQLSNPSSPIQLLSNGSVSVAGDLPYKVPTVAMAKLHLEHLRQESSHFSTLFKAYHGDIPNTADLENSLNTFYLYDARVAQHFSGR